VNHKIEIHGHRGFRGHFPENTLISFKEAAKLGVDAIELDVVISKDSQVVVSHEPWFNHKICSEPNGDKIRARHQYNLYKLNYSEIKKYDCGKRGNVEFPEQQHIAEYKPLLSEVIETLEQFCKENNLPPIQYNIEIKSGKIGDGIWHPSPEKIALLVHDVIKNYNINERIMIQSFDVRSLQAYHKIDPHTRIGLLIVNTGSVKHNLHKLGFIPYMYNPALKLTKENTIAQVHKSGCKIMVWTVNSEEEMIRMIQLGVDGLITDYPNIALKLRKP
jgi:glycerophosphoryl diester phosphodiesterase